MKKYLKPEFETYVFCVQDVIAASGPLTESYGSNQAFLEENSITLETTISGNQAIISGAQFYIQ